MTNSDLAEVVCTSTHPIDLSDGRSLAPGETAVDVDTDHPHQRALFLDGHINVLEGKKPRARQADNLVTEAKQKEDGQ